MIINLKSLFKEKENNRTNVIYEIVLKTICVYFTDGNFLLVRNSEVKKKRNQIDCNEKVITRKVVGSL